MNHTLKVFVAASCLSLTVGAQAAETVTIATVNNSDMIRMQRLAKTFEEQHPDIKLKWVVLEENVLRQRLTTDIATQGGQFDVLTIGMYEAALWGEKGWLEPMKDLPADYALDDVFPPCAKACRPRVSSTRCRSTPKPRSPITARTCSSRPG